MSGFFGPLQARVTSIADAWSRFWFTPADPTLLGLMRLLAGMVTLYTFVIHGFTMDKFLAQDAWFGAAQRLDSYHDRAIYVGPLLTSPLYAAETPPPPPADDLQLKFVNDYQNNFLIKPPGPHPQTPQESEFAIKFRRDTNIEFRYYGLPFPKNDWEKKVLFDYVAEFNDAFPPPYPAENDHAAVEEIRKYRTKHQFDPRRLYARGMPIFSVWLDVHNPTWMRLIQGGFVVAAFCFTFGLGTRVSSAIVWFANLCYVHRSNAMLFGVDTMMTVLLLYFMIGPSGAAVSLDRLVARWWSRAKPRFFPNSAPATYAPTPAPRVSANLALRMMQVHLCTIYFVSGVSKLAGPAWWNGTAVWGVLSNFEFAPMNLWFYNEALRWLCTNELTLYVCINGAGFMTLAFEIAYPFLVWRPTTRWLMLIGAIFLHGFIGLLMGLKTFSLMMLVFNMAFLRPEEVSWILSWIVPAARTVQAAGASPRRKPEPALR
jgi:hypothetical protein